MSLRVTLIQGGVTHNNRFGDYSSTMIDPVNPGQVCAVSANEYFGLDGRWRTYISRFGAAVCASRRKIGCPVLTAGAP